MVCKSKNTLNLRQPIDLVFGAYRFNGKLCENFDETNVLRFLALKWQTVGDMSLETVFKSKNIYIDMGWFRLDGFPFLLFMTVGERGKR